jgi:hypothetical protein
MLDAGEHHAMRWLGLQQEQTLHQLQTFFVGLLVEWKCTDAPAAAPVDWYRSRAGYLGRRILL